MVGKYLENWYIRILNNKFNIQSKNGYKYAYLSWNAKSKYDS